MRKPGESYDVSPEAFATAFATAGTVSDVAEMTGMPIPIIYDRASKYRKAGVELPKLRRRTKHGLDVDALNRRIKGNRSRRVTGAATKPGDGVRKVVKKLLEGS